MKGYGNYGNSTMPSGANDRRTHQTGHRVLFEKTDLGAEQWLTTRGLKRLQPQYLRMVRLLVEACLVEQMHSAVERMEAK